MGSAELLYEALRANYNIKFEPQKAGLLSPDAKSKLSHNISIDILNWNVEDVEAQHYLEVSVRARRRNLKAPVNDLEYLNTIERASAQSFPGYAMQAQGHPGPSLARVQS